MLGGYDALESNPRQCEVLSVHCTYIQLSIDYSALCYAKNVHDVLRIEYEYCSLVSSFSLSLFLGASTLHYVLTLLRLLVSIGWSMVSSFGASPSIPGTDGQSTPGKLGIRLVRFATFVRLLKK